MCELHANRTASGCIADWLSTNDISDAVPRTRSASAASGRVVQQQRPALTIRYKKPSAEVDMILSEQRRRTSLEQQNAKHPMPLHHKR